MSSLTGDRTAKPVSRDQILRREQEFRLVVEIENPETGRDRRTCSRDQILTREQGIRLSVENKHAVGGRDGRTCLARPNSQALTGIQDECGE